MLHDAWCPEVLWERKWAVDISAGTGFAWLWLAIEPSPGTRMQNALMRTTNDKHIEREGKESNRAGQPVKKKTPPTGICPRVPDGQYTAVDGYSL